MDIKEIGKLAAKMGLKLGLDYALTKAAEAVAEKPEKGAQIAGDVKKLGDLVAYGAQAIADGNFTDEEKATLNKQIEEIVEAIFAY